MKFKEKIKNILSCTLAIMILISSTPVHGSKPRFKDVPKSRWSYQYIEKSAKLGYLEGKGSGIFGPEDHLTFLESMAALSRLTKPTENEIKNAKNQYSGLMDELKIKEDWEREALSVAIYKGIVSVSEVKIANNEKMFHKPIQKVAISVFLAKAMGLEEKANNLSVVFLEYNDVLEIEPPLRKYLKVLLDAGVLDKKGDSTGNFNPKQPLKREILATMLSRAEDYLVKNPGNRPGIEEGGNPETPVEPEKPEIKTETHSGIIKRVTEEIGKSFLVIEDNNGRESSFIIEKDTTINVGGKEGTIKSLVEGQEVIVEVEKESRKLVSIESEVREEIYKGVVKYINPISKEIELGFNQSGKESSKMFNLAETVRVSKDGISNANITNIKFGDYVELIIRNGKVVDINAKSKELKLEGKIVGIKETRDSKVKIYVETKDNREYDILVDDRSYIERDGQLSRPEDLRETDEVYIVARYNIDEEMYIAEEIEADIIVRKVRGRVIETSNRINQNPLITIKNNDNGREESYELSSSAYIEVDGRRSDSLPENPGYEVEMLIEGGNEIVEIFAETFSMETSIVGRIKYIDHRANYMEVETSSIGRNKEVIRVHVEPRTIITDRNLRRLRIRDLFEDDYVNIIGVYKGANFVADTISLR